MSHNGRRPQTHRIELVTPGADAQESAAIAGAIERFLADAQGSAQRRAAAEGWQRAGLLEGVGLDPQARDSWGGR